LLGARYLTLVDVFLATRGGKAIHVVAPGAVHVCQAESEMSADEKCMWSETKEQMRADRALHWQLRSRHSLIENILKVGPAAHLFTSQNGSDRTENVTRRAKAAECQPVALTTRVKRTRRMEQMSKHMLHFYPPVR
jgi:hypothetical protein